MNSLQQVCEQLPPIVHILIWGCLLLWEYGLGKTKLGSSVGLFIETPIKKAVSWLKLGNL